MTKLERETGLNPFILNGRIVSQIIFYDESGEIVRVDHGFFGRNNFFKNGLEIPEAKKRIKENFAKKECFYMNVKNKYKWENPSFCLYLYVDGVKIKQNQSKERKEALDSYQTYVYKEYSFDILGVNVTFEKFVKREETPLYKEFEKIKKAIEDKNITVRDEYFLCQLVEKFKIVER